MGGPRHVSTKYDSYMPFLARVQESTRENGKKGGKGGGKAWNIHLISIISAVPPATRSPVGLFYLRQIYAAVQ